MTATCRFCQKLFIKAKHNQITCKSEECRKKVRIGSNARRRASSKKESKMLYYYSGV